MTIPKVTGYKGVIPDRRTQSAEDFTSAAVTWTDYQATTLVPSTNAAIDGINAAQDEILDSVNNAEESSFIAQAAANYQGAWFSGAQVVKGESWSHNGLMWAANVDGAGEPQENAQWFLLNSEPELSAIKVMLEQWGYRYAGLFDDGFTYSQVGDAGVDNNNDAWIYVGAGAPNKVVTAGTVPSVGDGYEQIAFNSLQNLVGLNKNSGLDSAYSRFTTVAELANGAFNVGDKLTVTDRYNAPFIVVDGSDYDGHSAIFAGSGKVAKIDINATHSGVNAGWFGIKVNDYSARAINFEANHSILKFIFTTLKSGSFNPLYGGTNAEMVSNIPVKYPTGVIYLEGDSPFHIPASDYPSVFDKKRGIVFQGNGTDSTIFEIIKPSGFSGTINYYDNMKEQDGSSGFGGWDKVWFKDMTLRTPYWIAGANTSRAKRPEDDKYNGFRKNSGGFEKFFRFENVLFQGFDTLDIIEGISNVDENHYHNCRFELIRDNVLLLKNPESVGHRYTDCDFEPILGNVVKAEKGGFVAINGGSIILYPQYDVNGPIASTESRAIFNIEADGSSIDARSGVYIARDITLEKYDTKQQLTRISQVGTVPAVDDDALTPRFPASSVDVQFHSCSFRTDTKQPDDTINTTENHNVIVINGDVLANVTLTDCALFTRHFYAFQGSNTYYGKGSKIKFVRPRLLWDPSKDNIVPSSWEGGTLADRCTSNGQGEITCEGASAVTTPKWFNTNRNFELDFTLRGDSVSTSTLTQKTAVIKRVGEPMVATSDSYAELGNSLAMYDGAEILGFEILVPQVPNSLVTGEVRVLSGELTSSDPNSFKVLHTELIDESVGLKKYVDLGYAASYKISNGNRLHVKWSDFSDPNINTASEVRVIYK